MLWLSFSVFLSEALTVRLFLDGFCFSLVCCIGTRAALSVRFLGRLIVDVSNFASMC